MVSEGMQLVEQRETRAYPDFEMLLATLSARFINLPTEQIDSGIEDAQRQVSEFLGLDISAIWQWQDNRPEYLHMTHLYRPLGDPPVPECFEASEINPWVSEEVKAGRSVILDDSEIIPAGAEKDRETWRYFGIKTVLCIPLKSSLDLPYGAISFHDTRQHRHWDEPLIQKMEMVAHILSNALMRKQLETELHSSKTKLTLATDSAGAGVWSLNLESLSFWTTDTGRKLFGFDPDEHITLDRFLELVHPDDRNSVKQTIDRMVKTEDEQRVEYRVSNNDSGIRWMSSRGRRQCQVPGETSCILMGVTVDITERKQNDEKLHAALEEIKQLRDQLKDENLYLREQLRRDDRHDAIVGESPCVVRMLDNARQVAATHSTVLINGETGTGKELLAQAIHDMSSRNKQPMIKVNCAALPASLIEGELFGREKGAYTGAVTKQRGRFEIADGSTIFLDEVGEIPLELQSKLLHVLQDGVFERLGSCAPIKVDVRLIAATNRDLAAMVKEGTFRQDLYHRLNVFPVEVPPLRERTADIPLLVWRLVQEFNTKMGRSISSIPTRTMKALNSYPWPGNVRELRNVIERAMILSSGNTLEIEIPADHSASDDEILNLEAVERKHIESVLKRTRWKVSGKGGAAELLGLVPTTLHSRMKKLGLVRPGV